MPKLKVHFFFKQWGGKRKHETRRELDGRTYDAMPILTDYQISGIVTA
jgi:protein gp37